MDSTTANQLLELGKHLPPELQFDLVRLVVVSQTKVMVDVPTIDILNSDTLKLTGVLTLTIGSEKVDWTIDWNK